MPTTGSSTWTEAPGTFDASGRDFGSAGSEIHQPLRGANPTGSVGSNTSDDSIAISAQLLVGIIAGSIIVVIVIIVLHSRRRKRKHKSLSSPRNFSGFQGVSSTTALENSSNTLQDSTASTVTSPQRMQTSKLPRRKPTASQEHVVIGINDTRLNRNTRGMGGFSASALMRGGTHPSLPGLGAFRSSRATLASRGTQTSQDGRLQSMDSSASTVSLAQKMSTVTTTAAPIPQERFASEGNVWRGLSETCWSIGPGSDSESECDEGSRKRRIDGRLSTLSDEVEDDLSINSLDDSSRRREQANLDRVREQDTDSLDDSSPRRVRGLSALGPRRKNNYSVGTETNYSVGSSCFSVDSEFYGESIRDCSAFDTGSDCSLREEWF